MKSVKKSAQIETQNAPAPEGNVTTLPAVETTVKETVALAPPTVHEVITEGLAELGKLSGDNVREHLIALLAKVSVFQPAKVEFSPIKATRKEQMQAYKDARKTFDLSLRRVHAAMRENGVGIQTERHVLSVAATGAVTSRRTEALKLSPPKGKIQGFRVG